MLGRGKLVSGVVGRNSWHRLSPYRFLTSSRDVGSKTSFDAVWCREWIFVMPGSNQLHCLVSTRPDSDLCCIGDCHREIGSFRLANKELMCTLVIRFWSIPLALGGREFMACRPITLVFTSKVEPAFVRPPTDVTFSLAAVIRQAIGYWVV